MANSFGSLFRITTFGESHGVAVGVVIDGCPPRHRIDLARVQKFLARRRPGQSALNSPRQERDVVQCLSGIDGGLTLGSPITFIVYNHDAKPAHYDATRNIYRPSHADYTTERKYGLCAASGGGRLSARETIGRVAAAGIAEQVLEHLIPGFKVVAFVDSVRDHRANISNPHELTRDEVDATDLRCPDMLMSETMRAEILSAKDAGDSVGGTVYCGISGVPAGLGEPVFDKLHANLAKAIVSLPACRGIEIGSGFESTRLLGSEHNDQFYADGVSIRTLTNHSGGIQGGISNGEFIYFRAAFKPVSTIRKPQDSVNRQGDSVVLIPSPEGRHDPCVLPRAVPMVEAMATLVIMDHFLWQAALIASSGERESREEQS